MRDIICHRRQLLRYALYTAAALPGTILLNNSAQALPDLPELSPDDPAAKTLDYTPDTKLVDKSTNPGHNPGQVCANCSLVINVEGDRRGCAMFPGKSVSVNGWCKAWDAKPS